MVPFIVVLTVTILSMVYVDRLIKIKFRDEKNPIWKTVHVIVYVIEFIPLLGVAYLVTDGNLLELGILFMAILLYLLLKNF